MTERNYASYGRGTTFFGLKAENEANQSLGADKRTTTPLPPQIIALPEELSDWLSGDVDRIRTSRAYLRSWFLAYFRTDTAEELSESHQNHMLWLYEMLDDFLINCMEQEYQRIITKGGEL